MRSVISFLLATSMILLVQGQDKCSIAHEKDIQGNDILESVAWKTLHSQCTAEVKKQIEKELSASWTYLSLGAHFSKDYINRPGFAKFFFESASEERQHAIKLIEYLSMRGESVTNIDLLVRMNAEKMNYIEVAKTGNVETEKKLDGKAALKLALEKEVSVTNSILEVMKFCEQEKKVEESKMSNDYHLVDWLTADFLDEQYKGQRDIAGKLSTLLKMGSSNYQLGEFLFDKKLLNNEV